MRLLIIALLATVVRGSVTFYSPGVMDRVYLNRLAWGHVQPCERCIGMIAVVEPGQVGKVAYLTRPGQAPEGPFLIIDTAADKDRARLQRRGLVAEVDYQTARRWGMSGPVFDVQVFTMEVHR